MDAKYIQSIMDRRNETNTGNNTNLISNIQNIMDNRNSTVNVSVSKEPVVTKALLDKFNPFSATNTSVETPEVKSPKRTEGVKKVVVDTMSKRPGQTTGRSIGSRFLGQQELEDRGNAINTANAAISLADFLSHIANVGSKIDYKNQLRHHVEEEMNRTGQDGNIVKDKLIKEYMDNNAYVAPDTAMLEDWKKEQEAKLAEAKDLSKYSTEEMVRAYENTDNYNLFERNMDFGTKKDALYTMKQLLNPTYNQYTREQTLQQLIDSDKYKEFEGRFIPTSEAYAEFVNSLPTEQQFTRTQESLQREWAEANGYSYDDLKLLADGIISGDVTENIKRTSEEMPILSSALSPAFNVVGGMQGSIYGLTNTITGEPIAYDSPEFAAQRGAETIRETVSEQIDNPYGEFVYNTGMSIADSLLAQGLGGGKLGTAIMGMGAYSSVLQDGAERGLTPTQMQTVALTAGLAEFAFEKIAWDNIELIAKGQASKNILANIAVQMGTEGAEEGMTEVTNILVDNLVNGGASEMVQLKEYYVSQGMTEEEAQQQVMLDYAKRIGLSVAGGAVSGGVTGGGASVYNHLTGNNQNTVTEQENQSKIPVLESEPEVNPIEQFAQDMQALGLNDDGTFLQPSGESLNGNVENTAPVDNTTQNEGMHNGQVEQIKVGRATIITSPYTGTVPEQSKNQFERVEVGQEDFDNAVINIQNAQIDSKINGGGVKTIVQRVYENLFSGGNTSIPVLVDGTTFEGKPYIVTVNKNAVGKIMNDGALSAEKLAVLDNVENVISNSEYVGSADYDNHNNKSGKVTRYDYFETLAKINGEDYIVKFDVEVIPGQNKYRTHKVINEIDLTKATESDAQAPVSEVLSPSVETVNKTAAQGGLSSLSNNSIPNLTGNVNAQVDRGSAIGYNNSVTSSNVSSGNGGNINVNESSRTGITGVPSGRTESGIADGRGNESGRTDGGRNSGVSKEFRIIKEAERQKLTDSGVTDNEFRDTTSNPELFSFALEAGKASNPNGVMVDSHTAEELQKEGAKTFLAKDNMAGGAVMPDGNITAVFKNVNSTSKRAGIDIIISALENGGDRLDCYGDNLLRLYSKLGFEPVARVKFNTEYAPEGWDYDKFGMPDIYVMKHNGKSVAKVIDDYVNGTARNFSKEEIEALDYMEYDDAINYRNSLMQSSNTMAEDTGIGNTSGTVAELEGKVRGYNESIVNKSDLPTEIKNEFINNPQFYEVLSNKTTLENANAILANSDTRSATAQFNRLIDQKNPVAVPLGYNLAKQLQQEGSFEEAVEVLRKMSEKLTEAGQFTQAAAITLMHGDPTTALQYLTREIDRLNAKGKERYGNKWTNFELTEAEQQELSSLDVGDEQGIKNVYEKVFARIRQQYPATMREKLTELRRISMLLNMRTNVRNVVSNALLLPVRWSSDRISALGQGVMHLVNPDYKSSQALYVNRQSKALAKEAWNTVKDTLLEDGKYEDVNGAVRDKQVFKGSKVAQAFDNITNGALTKANEFIGKRAEPSLLETARNFTYWLLKQGDDVFVKKNFVDRMASYLSAQKITDLDSIPADAYTLATQEALKATFKDDNSLTKMFSNIKKNTGLVGEVILPFTKTPANLAMRGYDYSIGGYIELFRTLSNSKSRTWADVTSTMDSLSKSVLGTGAIALGYALAAAGFITGPLSDDEDEAAFQKLQGMLPYSLHIGDNYYTYDWAQPAAIPLILGATIYNSTKESDSLWNGIYQGSLAAVDSWFSLSPLQNVQEIFGGYGTPAENIADAFLEAPLSFIPAQMGALARTADTTQRVTYSNGNPLETLANSAVSRIPFLSESLPAAYDTWGNEIQRSDTTGEAAFAQLLNPGQLGNSNITPIDNEISRLYDSTGNSAVFPQKVNWSYTIDGESVKLDNEQYSEMQRLTGVTSYEAAEHFINASYYGNMSDDARADILGDIYSFAQANAKHEMFGYDIANSDTYKKKYEAYQAFGAEGLVDYMGYKEMADADGSGSLTQEEIKGFLSAQPNLTQSEKADWFDIYFPKAKVNPFREDNSTSSAITVDYINSVINNRNK